MNNIRFYEMILDNPVCAYIHPNILESRLDPKYYDPSILDLLNKLELNTNYILRNVRAISSKINSGPFGSSLLASQYVERGIPFFRPLNLKDIVASKNNLVFISKKDWQKLRSSQFQAGDILVTKIGNGIGDVGIIPHGIIESNISGNLMGFRVKDGYDPYFIVAYLKCNYSNQLINRALTDTAKPKIGTSDIANLPVPIPDINIQEYIGAKVKLAEKCRKEAVLRRDRLNDFFDQLCSVKREIENIPSKAHRQGYFLQSNRLENRLDAEFYQPKFSLLMERLVENSQIYKQLRKIISRSTIPDGHPWVSDGFMDNGIPVIRIRNIGLGTINTVNATCIHSDLAFKNQNAILKPYEIVIGMDGSEFRAAILHPFDGVVVVNQRVAMIQNIDPPDAALITYLINYFVGYQQLIRQKTTAAVVGHITKQNILNMFLPWDFEDRKDISRIALEETELLAWARKLITKAKNDVEALIQGSLNTNDILSGSIRPMSWEDIEANLSNK